MQATMIHYRPIGWPQDAYMLSEIDSQFTTDRVIDVVRDGLSFRLGEKTLPEPLRKRYEWPTVESDEPQWDLAVAAMNGNSAVGFVAIKYESWNRRANILHLYVDLNRRGVGIGSRLLLEAEEFARRVGARHLWVETQNVNYPGIQFYSERGFSICGLDLTLYDPLSLAGEEIALFLCRPVRDAGNASQ
jgi:ribosomal protein S18 acetylase RimI-like enzyme